MVFTNKKTLILWVTEDESITFVVPPHFVNALRHLPYQVRHIKCLYSYPVTGIPGITYYQKRFQSAAQRPIQQTILSPSQQN